MNLKILKKLTFPLLFLIVYLLLIGTVIFGDAKLSDVGATISLQLLLLIIVLLSVPNIADTEKKYEKPIYLTLLIAGIVTACIAFFLHSGQHAIFILCSHIVLIVYIWLVLAQLRVSKIQNIRIIGNSGLSIIAILLAVVYTTTLWTAGAGFSVNCDDLRDQTIGLINSYIPSLENNSTLLRISKNIETFGSKTFGQVLGTTSINSEVAINTSLQLTGIHQSALLISWATIVSGTIVNGTIVSGTIVSWTVIDGGILSSVITYQQNLIKGVLSNQEFINSQVCDLTVSHIEELTSKDGIQLLGFILIVLLLIVFMKSILLIVGIVNTILLRILFKCKRFTIIKKKEECEVITL